MSCTIENEAIAAILILSLLFYYLHTVLAVLVTNVRFVSILSQCISRGLFKCLHGIFSNCEKSNYGTEPPEKVIKVPFEIKNAFNSTMMASFLRVIVSKRNKQTEKTMPFLAVSHKFA